MDTNRSWRVSNNNHRYHAGQLLSAWHVPGTVVNSLHASLHTTVTLPWEGSVVLPTLQARKWRLAHRKPVAVPWNVVTLHRKVSLLQVMM